MRIRNYRPEDLNELAECNGIFLTNFLMEKIPLEQVEIYDNN